MQCRIIYFALLLAAVGLLPGCGDQTVSTTGNEVKALEVQAKAFIDASPATQTLFVRKDAAVTPGFRLEVFVDQSASMHGYADYERGWASFARPVRKVSAPSLKSAVAPDPTAEKPPSSDFVRLLRAFANEEELLGYFGFGSDASGKQTIFPLGKSAPLDPKGYTRINNDYADLLQQFDLRPAKADGLPVERVIITDGVQSHHDLGAGSALSQTVRQLQGWIDRGGVVEVRRLAAPYAGTYYSEELRSRGKPYSYAGKVPDRPFILISLLSGLADLTPWDQFWKRNAMSGVTTAAVLRCPAEAAARAVTFEPEERIPKEQPADVLFRNVWDLSRIVTLDGYHDLWRALIRRPGTQTESNPPTYPACFLLHGIESTDEAGAAAELLAMKPALEIWQGPGAAKPTPAGGKTTPGPEAAAWQQKESVDLRDLKNGKVQITHLTTPANSFRFTATLPLPPKSALQAVVLRATPPAPPAPPAPNWRSASTLDDSTAADLDKIYNLQPFIEQLTSRAAREPAPVGALVLTTR